MSTLTEKPCSDGKSNCRLQLYVPNANTRRPPYYRGQTTVASQDPINRRLRPSGMPGTHETIEENVLQNYILIGVATFMVFVAISVATIALVRSKRSRRIVDTSTKNHRRSISSQGNRFEVSTISSIPPPPPNWQFSNYVSPHHIMPAPSIPSAPVTNSTYQYTTDNGHQYDATASGESDTTQGPSGAESSLSKESAHVEPVGLGLAGPQNDDRMGGTPPVFVEARFSRLHEEGRPTPQFAQSEPRRYRRRSKERRPRRQHETVHLPPRRAYPPGGWNHARQPPRHLSNSYADPRLLYSNYYDPYVTVPRTEREGSYVLVNNTQTRIPRVNLSNKPHPPPPPQYNQRSESGEMGYDYWCTSRF